MNLEIITQPLTFTIHGFSGIAANKEYAGTAFKLMDKMWKIVKADNLPNKGLNIWVYEPGESVFAGVELIGLPAKNTGLEQKKVSLLKYARYKHIGSYHLIKESVQNMTAGLERKGYQTSLPYIEMYGHWTNDETKLETDLLISLR